MSNAGQIENPYWLTALIEPQTQENGYLSVVNSTNGFKFAFPDNIPIYLNQIDTKGWTIASGQIKEASREIFSELNEILDISFTEITHPYATSVIAIMSNEQTDTTGYAYNPLDVDVQTANFLFSDVFLGNDYNNPQKSSNKTNFEYELLIHEIGHAMGLKHPFKNQTGDGVFLSSKEENNKWTVMSYTFDKAFFDGSYRMLDIASLANIYGINENYNSESNIYKFSPIQGLIIIDGNGEDTISADNQILHTYIDLRQQSHSYVGSKSSLITDPFQISVGNSLIENAQGGQGNDWLIGNNLNNILRGNSGNDVIYGGIGSDTIYGGLGNDTIDLTETAAFSDTVVFEDDIIQNGIDSIYSFQLGQFGDKLSFFNFSSDDYLIDIISLEKNNLTNISGKILRFVGEEFISLDNLKLLLNNENSKLASVDFKNDTSSIFINSKSHIKGEDQKVFYVENQNNYVEVTHIATIIGSDLQLSDWTSHNIL